MEASEAPAAVWPSTSRAPIRGLDLQGYRVEGLGLQGFRVLGFRVQVRRP